TRVVVLAMTPGRQSRLTLYAVLAAAGRLALRSVRGPARHLRGVRDHAGGLRAAGRAASWLAGGNRLGSFVFLVEVLAVGMGIGKASVYKYIPEYFSRDVGRAPRSSRRAWRRRGPGALRATGALPC